MNERALLLAVVACGVGCFEPVVRAGRADAGATQVCGAGTVACAGQCVVTTTEDDNCGGCGVACGAGKACAASRCFAVACGVTSCAPGSVCYDARRCVQKPCVEVTCPEGEACYGGRCLPRACGSQTCDAWSVCLDGACVDPGCEGVICPQGSTCRGGMCQFPGCANELKDSDEADVDCGGSSQCPRCVDGRRCQNGSDCESGHCVGGVCARCSASSPCGGGQVCTGAGACAPCSPTVSCSAGEVCAAGRCGPCAGPTDCPAGQGCVAGRCGACSASSQCRAGEVCTSGACVRACAASSDCAEGRVCELATGQCVPCSAAAQCAAGAGCRAASGSCGACAGAADCRPGEGCRAGVCGRCMQATECGDGGACRADGTCGPCGSGAECPAGQGCGAGNACGACRSGADCATGQGCRDGGTCGTCAVDAECAPGLTCALGACVVPQWVPTGAGTVMGTGVCGGVTCSAVERTACSTPGRRCYFVSPCSPTCNVGETCGIATCMACTNDGGCGNCMSARDCPAGLGCLPGGACGACTQASQCRPGEVCQSGSCGPCTSSAQCSGGRVCLGGACSACTSSAQCPQGFSCASGACVDNPPTVVLSSSAPGSVTQAFGVTATFSEPVTGFQLADLNVGNGTATGLTGGGAVYSFTVTPAQVGQVSVQVRAGAATDSAGQASLASNTLTRTNSNPYLALEGRQIECSAWAGPTGVSATASARVSSGALEVRLRMDAWCCGGFYDSGWLSASSASAQVNACCGFGWPTASSMSASTSGVSGQVDYGNAGTYVGSCTASW